MSDTIRAIEKEYSECKKNHYELFRELNVSFKLKTDFAYTRRKIRSNINWKRRFLIAFLIFLCIIGRESSLPILVFLNKHFKNSSIYQVIQ